MLESQEHLQTLSTVSASPTSASSLSFWELCRQDIQTMQGEEQNNEHWLTLLVCSAGLQALLLHRFSHWLHRLQMPFVPRFLSQLTRFLTGIEIHPAAQIGAGVCIMHGIGIVIGETAIVGDGCILYQGVTLGGTGKETGKRHPTLGKNVIVDAGAKVLGNLNIGNNVTIAPGAVVLRDVPENHFVVGIPGRIFCQTIHPPESLYHNLQRDIEAQVIEVLFERIKQLEAQLEQLIVQKEQDTQTHLRHLSPQSDKLIEDFLDGSGI